MTGDMYERTIGVLGALLDSVSDPDRRETISLLLKLVELYASGASPDPGGLQLSQLAIDQAVQMLVDDHGLPQDAAAFLRDLKPRTPLQAAEAGIDSPDPRERFEAVNRIAGMVSVDAQKALVRAMRHPAQDVRAWALLQLAFTYHDGRVTPTLRRLYDHAPQFVAECDPAALSLMLDAGQFSRMRNYVPDAELLRLLIVRAWGSIGETALSDLLHAIRHAWPYLRAEAVTMLGKIGAQAAVPALERCLEDEAQEVREAAGQAMTRIYGGDVY